jgi:predicted PurR-regulated permease PerM
VRSVSTQLTILAAVAIVGFLLLARVVVIPITIALLASYALAPVVTWLQERARVPRALGAAVTLILVLAAMGAAIFAVQPQAMHVLDIVPRATEKLTSAFKHRAFEPPGAVEKIQKAATEIEKAANNVGASSPDASKGAAPPAKPAEAFSIRQYIVMGTASLVAGAGQLVAIVALVYLLLAAGDTFRRTLVRVSGDTLSHKKTAVQILDEIDAQVQRYLLVQVASGALLAVVFWALFAFLGLENALFWACLGGVLHLIPYVGSTALVVAVGLVSYVQFDELRPVIVLVATTLVIITFINMVLIPLLTQRVGKLNAVAVFVALLFWGWLWGVWGLLLGVPIVMAFHAVCERVEGLHPIAEFMGMPKTRSD